MLGQNFPYDRTVSLNLQLTLNRIALTIFLGRNRQRVRDAALAFNRDHFIRGIQGRVDTEGQSRPPYPPPPRPITEKIPGPPNHRKIGIHRYRSARSFLRASLPGGIGSDGEPVQKEDAVVNIRAPNNAGSEREQATTTAARPVMKDILVNQSINYPSRSRRPWLAFSFARLRAPFLSSRSAREGRMLYDTYLARQRDAFLTISSPRRRKARLVRRSTRWSTASFESLSGSRSHFSKNFPLSHSLTHVASLVQTR